jgi:hypothetical protein
MIPGSCLFDYDPSRHDRPLKSLVNRGLSRARRALEENVYRGEKLAVTPAEEVKPKVQMSWMQRLRRVVVPDELKVAEILYRFQAGASR